MNLDEALKTFVVESRELLENMEAALLRIEQAPEDAGLIDAIFRAVHTIKGSAGLFGIDHIVAFTHHAENILDMVRKGELNITDDLVALFLDVCDHTSALIDNVAENTEARPEVRERGEELVSRLSKLLGKKSELVIVTPDERDIPRIHENDGDGAKTGHWHLSLRFNHDVLKNGMDPASLIRYLTAIGKIVSIVTLTDAIPRADEMDPEDCYLGFEIGFQSDADKAIIEGAFEFVREDARIRILPPHSKISEYLDLIHDLPEEEMRLGEILVFCGTLTKAELANALEKQNTAHGNDGSRQAIGEILVTQHEVPPELIGAALLKQKQLKENKASDVGLIRVNAKKLDEHINLIGELIIASAGINLAAISSSQSSLLEAASTLNRLVESVRDSALQLRMVQIGATFNKFQRVVRDVSRDIGKDIVLEISGAETELDKTLVEKIGDPLTHLVRNSVDHGIESAQIRQSRGKPAHGTLRLNAYHDSGSIVIEVSDDGGGLDKKRILAKATERGLVNPDQELTEDEIHALIFEPGFSTAEQVNNLSGRGVGMDVVRRNINALRGSVEIDSAEGIGTTIRIRLPLTLAIIDGFLIGVGTASFVLPLEMVVECVELTQAEIDAAQGRNQLDLRGEVLPFIRLRDLFDNSGRTPQKITATVPADEQSAFLLQPVKRENVVVVNHAGLRAGLVVDTLQGEYQTVIRPLGTVFSGLHGISGFTILGNGQVALILDVPGLVRRVASRESRRSAKTISFAAVNNGIPP